MEKILIRDERERFVGLINKRIVYLKYCIGILEDLKDEVMSDGEWN